MRRVRVMATDGSPYRRADGSHRISAVTVRLTRHPRDRSGARRRSFLAKTTREITDERLPQRRYRPRRGCSRHVRARRTRQIAVVRSSRGKSALPVGRAAGRRWHRHRCARAAAGGPRSRSVRSKATLVIVSSGGMKGRAAVRRPHPGSMRSPRASRRSVKTSPSTRCVTNSSTVCSTHRPCDASTACSNSPPATETRYQTAAQPPCRRVQRLGRPAQPVYSPAATLVRTSGIGESAALSIPYIPHSPLRPG